MTASAKVEIASSRAGSGGQADLIRQVMDRNLCTACGACAVHCPYLLSYRDRVAALHSCDLQEGKCHASCPRAGLNLAALREALYPGAPVTDELGPLVRYHQARSLCPEDRRGVQHGGVVTRLMILALEEGFIEAAIIPEKEERFLPKAITVTDPAEIRKRAGSRFVLSPLLAELRRGQQGGMNRLGIILLPCQLQALAKMHSKAATPEFTGDLPFRVGLFCGWRLDWRTLVALLRDVPELDHPTAMDIPPRREILEITAGERVFSFPLTEIDNMIIPACRFCVDSTAEFSDISVGAAAGAPGRGWNQVLIRTSRGLKIFDRAVEKGLIEIRPATDGGIEELKQAALLKKRKALAALAAASGRPDDLIYLDPRDPAVAGIQGSGSVADSP